MSDLQSSQPLSIYPTAARWSLQQSLDHYQQRFIDFYDSYETIWRMDPFEAIWRTDPFEAIWRMDFILRDVDPDRSLKALALLLDELDDNLYLPVHHHHFDPPGQRVIPNMFAFGRIPHPSIGIVCAYITFRNLATPGYDFAIMIRRIYLHLSQGLREDFELVDIGWWITFPVIVAVLVFAADSDDLDQFFLHDFASPRTLPASETCPDIDFLTYRSTLSSRRSYFDDTSLAKCIDICTSELLN